MTTKEKAGPQFISYKKKGANNKSITSKSESWRFLTGTGSSQKRYWEKDGVNQGPPEVKFERPDAQNFKPSTKTARFYNESSNFLYMSRNPNQLFPHSFSKMLPYRLTIAPITKNKADLYGRGSISLSSPRESDTGFHRRFAEFKTKERSESLATISDRHDFSCREDLSVTSLRTYLPSQRSQTRSKTINLKPIKNEAQIFKHNKINLRSMTALPCLTKRKKPNMQAPIKPNNQTLKYKAGLKKDELSLLIKTAPPRIKLKQFSGKLCSSSLIELSENIIQPKESVPFPSPKGLERFQAAWLPILKKHQKRLKLDKGR